MFDIYRKLVLKIENKFWRIHFKMFSSFVTQLCRNPIGMIICRLDPARGSKRTRVARLWGISPQGQELCSHRYGVANRGVRTRTYWAMNSY